MTLETRLAETLHALAERAPGADDVLSGLDQRPSVGAPSRPSWHRWLVPALAVAIVAVLVAGAISWLGPGGSRPSDPAPATAPVVPDGTRLVGWGRVAVAVPQQWGRSTGPCGPREPNVVHFDVPAGPRIGCTLIGFRGTALEVLSADSDRGRLVTRAAAPAGNVDGVDVLRTDYAIVLPTEGVVFQVRSRDEEVVTTILDSLQVLPAGWTAVTLSGWSTYAPLAENPAPDVPGLETKVREVWRPAREPGDWVGLHPKPGNVVAVGSTLTMLVATDEAPIGLVETDHQVTLWHCGINPTTFAGHHWEVSYPPPFDATNAPRPYDDPDARKTFTGNGTMELVADDRAAYTDDGGARLVFHPADDPITDPPQGWGCA